MDDEGEELGQAREIGKMKCASKRGERESLHAHRGAWQGVEKEHKA